MWVSGFLQVSKQDDLGVYPVLADDELTQLALGCDCGRAAEAFPEVVVFSYMKRQKVFGLHAVKLRES